MMHEICLRRIGGEVEIICKSRDIAEMHLGRRGNRLDLAVDDPFARIACGGERHSNIHGFEVFEGRYLENCIGRQLFLDAQEPDVIG